jgi:hypothetical protein
MAGDRLVAMSEYYARVKTRKLVHASRPDWLTRCGKRLWKNFTISDDAINCKKCLTLLENDNRVQTQKDH